MDKHHQPRRGIAASATSTSHYERKQLTLPFVSHVARDEKAAMTAQLRELGQRTAATDAKHAVTYVRPPVAVVATRRKKGKAQRQARAAHRQAAKR